MVSNERRVSTMKLQTLDGIPWESSEPLVRHPYCRMPSIHFVHLGYHNHRSSIENGLINLTNKGISFYVLNPENDLPSDRIETFVKKRFPSWIGVINEAPTPAQIIDALKTYKLYVYCGHGSGSQYLKNQDVSQLKIERTLQFLIGCSSGALKDHGGDIERTGDILQYIAAGSGCTTAMLWSITNTDADQMTMVLVNSLLPGKQISIPNLKKIDSLRQEPELLRAIVLARGSADVFSNGAALIARGLPMKIIPG